MKFDEVKPKFGAMHNQNDTCHTCAKGCLDSNFSQAVINKNRSTKILVFKE